MINALGNYFLKQEYQINRTQLLNKLQILNPNATLQRQPDQNIQLIIRRKGDIQTN